MLLVLLTTGAFSSSTAGKFWPARRCGLERVASPLAQLQGCGRGSAAEQALRSRHAAGKFVERPSFTLLAR